LIELTEIGKRFEREWIFRHLSASFLQGYPTAILGRNGSGKSTLLRLISGQLLQTEGSITFSSNEKSISPNNIFRYLTCAAPYVELPYEYSLYEAIHFQTKFKTLIKGIEIADFLEITELKTHRNKFINDFSSGMRQRLKLALAILFQSDIILLDEPCSNLDDDGVGWYKNLINNYAANRILIICSNRREEEYYFCSNTFEMESFKV
jgi:ABC-type multidrug transport system ATPase subunit